MNTAEHRFMQDIGVPQQPLAAGMLATVAWLALPHLAWLGGLGAVVLLAGAWAAVTLPFSAAAAFLLVLAAASLLMEVYAAPGLLLHAAGGAVALTLAGLCLHQPWTGVHPLLAIAAAVGTCAGTWLTARRSHRARSHLPGRDALVLTTDGDHGLLVVNGYVCRYHHPSGPLAPGDQVRISSDSHGWLVVTRRLPD